MLNKKIFMWIVVGLFLFIPILFSNQFKALGKEKDEKIEFYYLTQSSKPNQPKMIVYLNAPDELTTIQGKWTYYINGQQMKRIQRMTVGSQTITISLTKLNPDRENQIRVHFQGMVDGRPYTTDQTYKFPSFSLTYQARTFQLKYKGADLDLIRGGEMMISIYDAKKKVIEICHNSRKPQLACKLSHLPPGQYQVVATFAKKQNYNEFAFRKKGKLELKANQQDIFTPEPTDLFPAQTEVQAQQIKDQWENGWLKWEQQKIKPPFVPRIGFEILSTDTNVKLIYNDQYDDKSIFGEHFQVSFFNENNQLIHFCEAASDHFSCRTPKQARFKLMVLYVGKMYNREFDFPIGIVQKGNYQDGRLSLSTPLYTRDIKSIKDQIATIQQQETHPEANDSNYMMFILVIILSLLLLLLIGRLFFIINKSKQS